MMAAADVERSVEYAIATVFNNWTVHFLSEKNQQLHLNLWLSKSNGTRFFARYGCAALFSGSLYRLQFLF